MLFAHRLLIACAALLQAGAPAYAQVDFAGRWESRYHEDGPGVFRTELGDYLGLPINAPPACAAIVMMPTASPWCRSTMPAAWRRLFHAWTFHAARGVRWIGDTKTGRLPHAHNSGMERTIWMDGRPHPPEYAGHTWSGFSTGRWDGHTLVVTTTHFKPNYMRRNGLPRSDKAVVTEWFRLHGNYMSVTQMVDDPVFLAEPLVRSSNWVRDPGQRMNPAFCEPAPEVPKEMGTVPHHLPGTNEFLTEVADWYGLPRAATRGGPQTMYPEYRKTMGKPEKAPPLTCERVRVRTT